MSGCLLGIAEACGNICGGSSGSQSKPALEAPPRQPAREPPAKAEAPDAPDIPAAAAKVGGPSPVAERGRTPSPPVVVAQRPAEPPRPSVPAKDTVSPALPATDGSWAAWPKPESPPSPEAVARASTATGPADRGGRGESKRGEAFPSAPSRPPKHPAQSSVEVAAGFAVVGETASPPVSPAAALIAAQPVVEPPAAIPAHSAAARTPEPSSVAPGASSAGKETPQAPLEEGLRALEESLPFFTGVWPSTRDDWNGDVGIRFVAQTACVVSALGRACSGELQEAALVTLWCGESQEAIAGVQVGPGSQLEGGYAFEALGEGVPLQAGREYRLTQRCRPGMPDRWFDGKATEVEVSQGAATMCCRLVGGVCRNGAGYPNREDGEYRRAGMVNFRMARSSLDSGVTSQLDGRQQRLELAPVTREELALEVARAAVEEEPSGREAVNCYMSVLAAVLAALADELSASAPGAQALVVLAPRSELRSLGSLEPVDSNFGLQAMLAAGASKMAARDPAFAEGLLAFGRRHSQGVCDEHGGPREAAFVVDHQTGEVLAAGVRFMRGARRVAPSEAVATLSRGMAVARTQAGNINVYMASSVRRGRALCLAAAPAAAQPPPAQQAALGRPGGGTTRV